MLKKSFYFCILLLFTCGLCFSAQKNSEKSVPPPTRTDNVRELIQGVEITDPYRWLEDGNSPETRAWIKSQNQYTDSIIDSLPHRKELKKRIAELMNLDWQSTPDVRNGRYFFYKRRAGQEMAVICMRKGAAGKDIILIDPNPMSKDKTTSVGMIDLSMDGTLLAYFIRRGGRDESSVRIFDVDKMKDLPDSLPQARYGGFSFKLDKSGFYYVRQESAGPRLYYHKMKTDISNDKLIFGSHLGPDKFIDAGVSEDGRYLLITVIHGSAQLKTEMYYQDLDANGPILPIVNDIDAKFYGAVVDNKLFIQTNWQASNSRIFCVDMNNPARENWRQIVPESNAVLQEFSLVGGRLFVDYSVNVCSRLAIFDPNGAYIGNINLPSLGSAGPPSGRWKSNEAFLEFSSFHIPSTIYSYNVSQNSKKIFWQLKVPVDSNKITAEQVWYKSKDGTNVPMFLVHSKSFKLDGKNPAFLTAYGGFSHIMSPYFSAAAVLWAQAGGVFALPSIRGGGEFGENWHRAGMLADKQNSFDDFLAAAQWLIDSNYTNPSRLVISGGSNGGLLVGAAITQRPDMFRAAVCTYPVLDMLRYQKFLVGRFWVSEYGSSDDPNQFKYLYRYSPYHNVKQGAKYPAVLFITGDLDTRVDPLHTRKMTALLQSVSSPGRPVLLRYFTKAGHSGGMPMSQRIDNYTDQFSFLFWQLGVNFYP